MARYKVNNAYLSEEEYSRHLADNWLAMILCGGVFLGGVGAYDLCPTDWRK